MKSTPSARHRARKLAVQALYQLHFLEASPSQVIKEFLEDNDLKRADVAYFEALVLGVSQQKAALWLTVCELLDREPEQIDPVEKSILLLGPLSYQLTWKFPSRLSLPNRLIWPRSLARTDSYKYVNSILDRLATTLSGD